MTNERCPRCIDHGQDGSRRKHHGTATNALQDARQNSASKRSVELTVWLPFVNDSGEKGDATDA